LRFLWSGRKKEKPFPPKEKPKKDLKELIKDYKAEKLLLSFVAKDDRGNIPESELKWLKEIEGQIIELLPGDFQKGVFKILARYRFDFLEFSEQGDWQQSFREISRDICHFLYRGAPYPQEPEWPPLPFSGEKFFFWLLTQAKTGKKSNKYENISAALVEAKEKEIILCHHMKGEDIARLANRILVVFAGEWAKQTAVLVDIMCELEGGELFVKELLGLEK